MIGSKDELSAYMLRKVRMVIKELDKMEVDTEGVLDAAVHDAHSESATEINNSGVIGQVHYLLTNGWKPADIIFRAKQTCEENGEKET